MKVGLVIPVYGRIHYLKQCFDSLKKSDLSKVSKIVIVNDCSPDPETWEYLKQQHFERATVLTAMRNVGVSGSLKYGLQELRATGCDTFINLDSDAIVSRNFVNEIIRLHEMFPNTIVSGFNTLTTNSRGRQRHPVYRDKGRYVEKRSIGGINMCFGIKILDQIVLPSLSARGHWDWNCCAIMKKQNKVFIVTSQSVVQHIGFNSSVGNTDSPDVAFDFVGTDENNKSIILQPRGIGDIIFCQTIAQKLISSGHEVTWPVDKQFLEGLKRAYPEINFIPDSETPVSIDTRKFTKVNGYNVYPIRFSDTIHGVNYKNVMRAKYDMMGMDFMDWKKCAMWTRDEAQENKLVDLVNAKGEYCLVNDNFTTAGRRAVLQYKTNLPIVKMDYIPGFSLFDWAKVIENATEIHTVSTSILYMFEVLGLSCIPSIYIRRPVEKDHSFYNYLFTKPFNYRP